jgi:hypothetical protein
MKVYGLVCTFVGDTREGYDQLICCVQFGFVGSDTMVTFQSVIVDVCLNRYHGQVLDKIISDLKYCQLLAHEVLCLNIVLS